MPNTFELISSVTVGSGGAATIDFTSIPSTFTDLCVKLNIRGSNSAVFCGSQLRFNSDSGSNYSYKAIQGDGAAVSSFTGSGSYLFVGNSTAATATANTFSNQEIYITNYAGSTQKTVSVDSAGETNATTIYANLIDGLWTGTAAITSISINNAQSSNWAQYSTAYLYGVKNA